METHDLFGDSLLQTYSENCKIEEDEIDGKKAECQN
jgi:hypothetical protein